MVLVRSLPALRQVRGFHSKPPFRAAPPSIEVPPSLTLSESLKVYLESKLPRSFLTFQNKFLRASLGDLYKAVDESTLQKVDNPSITVKSLQVPIYNHTETINEVCLENVQRDQPTDLVMLHGFGAGLGCYNRNFKGLVESNDNIRIHALDWLGFGGSSNPKINLSVPYIQPPRLEVVKHADPAQTKIHNKYYHLVEGYRLHYDYPGHGQQYVANTTTILTEIENYYIDALEAWRVERGLARMCLMGHSYGGYLVSAYAMKYPQNVSKLVLVSPVGIEKNPLSIHNPELVKASLESAPKVAPTLLPTLDPSQYGFLGRFPIMAPWFVKFWNNNLSFLTLIRLAGPLGPRLLSLYTMGKAKRGASSLSLIFQLNQYSYNLFTHKSSSETAITKLLNGAVMAKNPLFDRVELMLQVAKVYWIYGEFDWMNREAGQMLSDKLNTVAQREVSSCYTIAKAGHNLYMDNPRDFNDLVEKILKE